MHRTKSFKKFCRSLILTVYLKDNNVRIEEHGMITSAIKLKSRHLFVVLFH